MAFLPRIKQASDAVLNISTGGSAVMTLDDRLPPAMATRPEMCSLNMGSMNFSIHPLADRYQAINIKLDKTGGLTEALRLRDAARADFDAARGPNYKYKSLLGDRKPPLDYRK